MIAWKSHNQGMSGTDEAGNQYQCRNRYYSCNLPDGTPGYGYSPYAALNNAKARQHNMVRDRIGINDPSSSVPNGCESMKATGTHRDAKSGGY